MNKYNNSTNIVKLVVYPVFILALLVLVYKGYFTAEFKDATVQSKIDALLYTAGIIFFTVTLTSWIYTICGMTIISKGQRAKEDSAIRHDENGIVIEPEPINRNGQGYKFVMAGDTINDGNDLVNNEELHDILEIEILKWNTAQRIRKTIEMLNKIEIKKLKRKSFWTKWKVNKFVDKLTKKITQLRKHKSACSKILRYIDSNNLDKMKKLDEKIYILYPISIDKITVQDLLNFSTDGFNINKITSNKFYIFFMSWIRPFTLSIFVTLGTAYLIFGWSDTVPPELKMVINIVLGIAALSIPLSMLYFFTQRFKYVFLDPVLKLSYFYKHFLNKKQVLIERNEVLKLQCDYDFEDDEDDYIDEYEIDETKGSDLTPEKDD